MSTPRWGMVIDLNRCVGCQTCTIACKHANDTSPGVQWRRVLDVEQGTFPDVERLFLVVGCQHCADPPCVPVCPTELPLYSCRSSKKANTFASPRRSGTTTRVATGAFSLKSSPVVRTTTPFGSPATRPAPKSPLQRISSHSRTPW